MLQPRKINISLSVNLSIISSNINAQGQPKFEAFFRNNMHNRFVVATEKLPVNTNLRQRGQTYNINLTDISIVLPGPTELCQSLEEFCIKILPPDEFEDDYDISETNLNNNKKCVHFEKQCKTPEMLGK